MALIQMLVQSVNSCIESRPMYATSAQRRLTTWIAIFAILAMAFAPAISQALGRWQGAASWSWAEICRSPGSATSSPADSEPAGDAALVHLFEHCPYCSNHTPTLGLPPADHPLVFIPPFRDEAPAAFLQAPRPLHAWASAQPRAPPLRG